MRLNKAPGSGRVSAIASVEEGIETIAAGGMVIVVDAPDRENEGDLVMAAEHATPEAVNFMATHGRGLICAPLPRSRLDELRIAPMVHGNTDPRRTAFHVSVDLHAGVTTGISARDRTATIRALANPDSDARDFTRPGHVFPLAAREGGVLARRGHTEAAIDLVRMAGLSPAAVICEIAREDGEMARLPDLLRFAGRHGLRIVSIADLVTARRRATREVRRVGEAALPLPQGQFTVVGYEGADGRDHVALVLGDVSAHGEAIVSVHAECLTGDVFGSLLCNCGGQLEAALDAIGRAGSGALVYLRRRDGDGVGILEERNGFAIGDERLATVPARVLLGHPVRTQDDRVAAAILDDLGVRRIRLLVNDPAERNELERHGVRIAARLPLSPAARPDDSFNLGTRPGHMDDVLAAAGTT